MNPMNDQAMRDPIWDLSCNGSGKAAALRPFSPPHSKSTKGVTEIQCSSMLADDGTQWALSAGHVSLEHTGFGRLKAAFSK